MYDCTTVQGATFDMHGQLYRRHANPTALFSSPVVSTLGSELDHLGSSPGQDKLCGKKKMQALLLGLADFSITELAFIAIFVHDCF